MLKKSCGYVLLVMGCLQLTGWAMSSPKQDLALVVVPERYSVIQVAFDLADKRPVVLVSYRQDPSGDHVLYAWSGKEWLHVGLTEFQEGSFLKVLPRKAVLVGGEHDLPDAIKDGVSWCPQVWQVPSIQTDDLVNAFGKIFRFRKSEWQWFSSRYKLDLEDKNEKLRKDSWYYHPYIEDAPKAPENTDPSLDS